MRSNCLNFKASRWVTQDSLLYVPPAPVLFSVLEHEKMQPVDGSLSRLLLDLPACHRLRTRMLQQQSIRVDIYTHQETTSHFAGASCELALTAATSKVSSCLVPSTGIGLACPRREMELRESNSLSAVKCSGMLLSHWGPEK